jgi:hypothetical protein
MEYIKGEENEVADKFSRLLKDKSRTTTNEKTSDSMETVQPGAMRLGREQFVSSTVDKNSSATLYSRKLQFKGWVTRKFSRSGPETGLNANGKFSWITQTEISPDLISGSHRNLSRFVAFHLNFK